jgi:hypothetical protein
MRGARPGKVAWLAALGLLFACATTSEPFYHRLLRERYAITDAELGALQFYISTEVLAHMADDTARVTPERVVIVPAGTPGRVREVGPDWLRVAFSETGEGVLFLTRSERTDSVYMLATITPGGRQIVRVSELPEPVVSLGSGRYRIIDGANAHLLVDRAQLHELIDRRPRAPGLER